MRSSSSPWRPGLLLVLGLTLLVPFGGEGSQGQEGKEDKVGVFDPVAFWSKRQIQQAAAAAELVGARNPLTMAVLRDVGFRNLVWTERTVVADAVPEFDAKWASLVRDRTPMPDFRERFAETFRPEELAAARIYDQAVVDAFETSPEIFARSAKENDYVQFAHLYNHPAKYRGKVLGFEGRLKRLRRLEVPENLKKEGVPSLYEGWVFGPTRGSHPYCVIVTYLPERLKPAEELDAWVSFSGYFYKLYRYRAGDGSDRDTPMFIGPTFVLSKGPVQAASGEMAVPLKALIWLTGIIGGIFLIIVGVSWWYRRGDRAFQDKLQTLRAEQALEMVEQAEAGVIEGQESATTPDQPRGQPSGNGFREGSPPSKPGAAD